MNNFPDPHQPDPSRPAMPEDLPDSSPTTDARIGLGISRLLMGFAPALGLNLIYVLAKSSGVHPDGPTLLTLSYILWGPVFLSYWSTKIVSRNQEKAIRLTKCVLLTILLIVCNAVLAFAGCVVIFPLRF